MVYMAFAGTRPRTNTDEHPTQFTADGYSLFAGGSLLLFGPVEAVHQIAANLNAEPPEPGRLAVRVMQEMQAAGGGVFLPREGLRSSW